MPLREDCGTLEKGDLRIIAESHPVPFITAFINTKMPKAHLLNIRTALFNVELNAELLVALESGEGFRRWQSSELLQQADSAAPVGEKKK